MNAKNKSEKQHFKVSPSGIRGIVGKGFSYDTIFKLALSFAEFSKGPIIVGRDSRLSGKEFSKAVVSAVEISGKKIIDLGILPTPTVLLWVKKMKAKGGIVITASHNPSDWNGLKLINSGGAFLNSRELKKLLSVYKRFEGLSGRQSVKRKEGNVKAYSRRDAVKAINGHIDTVLGHLNKDLIRKRRFKVGIDPVNGAGALISRKFLEKLNCQVFSVNEKPSGKFGRPPEPLSKHLHRLSKLVKKHNLDIGFAQDPDADRLAVVSESGRPIGEEFTLVLAFQSWLNKYKDTRSKNEKAIVINFATTQMIEDIAQGAGWKVWRTKVGEVNIVEKMKKIDASFGGEGNGGVICPAMNWARDSVAGMGLILELAVSVNKTISELREELPKYYRINEKIKIPALKNANIFGELKKELKPFFKKGEVDFTDGIRMKTKNSWWLVRLSNTEPIIRIMGEGRNNHQVKTVIGTLKRKIKQIGKSI